MPKGLNPCIEWYQLCLYNSGVMNDHEFIMLNDKDDSNDD